MVHIVNWWIGWRKQSSGVWSCAIQNTKNINNEESTIALLTNSNNIGIKSSTRHANNCRSGVCLS